MFNFSNDFLERCRKVTDHYAKDNKWLFDTQMLKIYEEVSEIHKAKNADEVMDEVCDVILSAVTMFHILGVPDDLIQVNLEKTLRKVEKRTGV